MTGWIRKWRASRDRERQCAAEIEARRAARLREVWCVHVLRDDGAVCLMEFCGIRGIDFRAGGHSLYIPDELGQDRAHRYAGKCATRGAWFENASVLIPAHRIRQIAVYLKDEATS